MKRYWYGIVALFVVLLQGCGEAPGYKEESAMIVLNTPAMKYADMGFIYESPSEIKVEIYGSGQALFTLRITSQSVCTSRFACLDRKSFNARMLSANYPKDTLERIFRAKPVFNGKNVEKKRNGFTQKLLMPGKYDIEYTVFNNETVFRDTINKILIKIKRMRG